jgi:hypothetical protein
MLRLMDILGGLALLGLLYIHYTGFAFLERSTVRNLPKDVRNNPGTYRSIYTSTTHTYYGGGK